MYIYININIYIYIYLYLYLYIFIYLLLTGGSIQNLTASCIQDPLGLCEFKPFVFQAINLESEH